MIKNLIQHGNSSALVIDKPIMELLKIKHDTPLEITTDGTNIIISPVKNVRSGSNLKKALKNIHKKHSGVLSRLAE